MGTKFSSLSTAERNLVRLMQSVHCGRLMNLLVRDGQPVLTPEMTVVRLVKLREANPGVTNGTANGMTEDFTLRREVLELLREIRAMRDGNVQRVEIFHGLPTTLEFNEPLASSTPASAS